MHPDGLRQVRALIRFYFHEDPKNDVERLGLLWGELKFALQFHGKLVIKERVKG
jgi:hypothetical protein